jgi:predicted N-acetyltransferase YhbS
VGGVPARGVRLSSLAIRPERPGDALRAARALTVSLEAEQGGVPVGHVALSPVMVAPDRQRQGIGAALIRARLDAAREAGAGVLNTLSAAVRYHAAFDSL